MSSGRRSTVTTSLRGLALAACSLAVLGFAAPASAKARHHAARAHHAAKAVEEDAETGVSSLQPLSEKDARAYASAFAAIKDGRFQVADGLSKTVRNKLLLGRVAYAKLMQPDYPATYEELADWLERYHDQAGAQSIYALARKKKPWAAAAPAAPDAAPGGESAIWARVETLAERIESAPSKTDAPEPPALPVAPSHKVDAALQAAREAFYAGDVEKALKLATTTGERWIGGLAAFRLHRYDEARQRFAALAEDPTENDWVRSGGAYWAARAAVGAGAAQDAPKYLQIAARTPYTFYGLIAERELGLDPGVAGGEVDAGVTAAAKPDRSGAGSPVVANGLTHLIRSDARAKRAAAYAQLGMRAEAGAELRAGLMGAAGPARQTWTRLGFALNAPLTSASDLAQTPARAKFSVAQFPTPDLNPEGGFTLDKALVYALVRQESRFDAGASSAAGAYGLMQLTPATAARVAGDDKLRADPTPLRNPAVNLKIGQAYVTRLLASLNGDMLHAVAAYNSGPGVIQKTLVRMGKNADPLLAIESMPGAQTRDFVQRVMAGYWIYRNLFGQDSPSLDAAASGRRAVSAALDQGAAPIAIRRPGPFASLFAPKPQ